MKPIITQNRRQFIATTGTLATGLLLANQASGILLPNANNSLKRLAIVGTGVRGLKFWGQFVKENYSDVSRFVALCDINPGRLAYSKKVMNIECPTYTNFDQMLSEVEIDLLFVTTIDSTHDEFIIKALKKGIDVATEKPMTTDEVKCQRILDTARTSKGKLIMGFNYRHGQLFTKLKQMLVGAEIGEITSIDFNWYLNTYHGADYFRRWHGQREKSGSLLLHKSSHHFDLLNWWIGSDPVEVHAYGGLDFYGKNSEIRGERCMTCVHKNSCNFFWDITKSEESMRLYVDHEKYDGYIRDNCLFRKEIDIFDKMAVQIKYANGVQVSYSLTAYSPYEGFRIAFNGKKGRMETWEGIPALETNQEDQSKIYEKEMDQRSHAETEFKFHEITTQLNFEEYKRIEFPFVRKGHWGGDTLMMDQILRDKLIDPSLHHAADERDGSMAVLIGIAARKSIDEGRAIKITELTDLKPRVDKWG
jgi:predicted dehydrogenase